MFKILVLSNISILLLILNPSISTVQAQQKEKMKQLSFMVGEWTGTSKGYKEGKLIRKEPAYQEISYDLDSSIIVIKLNSKSLLLHTIVYFDEKDNTYYYYPFSKRGVR